MKGKGELSEDYDIPQWVLDKVKPGPKDYTNEGTSKTIKNKRSNVMKGRTDITVKDGIKTMKTNLEVKKGLTTKEKKALRKNVIDVLDKKIEGGYLILDEDDEDYNDSDDEEDEKKELDILKKKYLDKKISKKELMRLMVLVEKYIKKD